MIYYTRTKAVHFWQLKAVTEVQAYNIVVHSIFVCLQVLTFCSLSVDCTVYNISGVMCTSTNTE